MRLTDTEREKLHNDIVALLEQYDYYYNDSAVDKIISEWESHKGWLVDAFKKHPNYVEGKYLIAYDVDYEREIDRNTIRVFAKWLMNEVVRTTHYAERLPDECHVDGQYLATQRMYDVMWDIHEIQTRTLDAYWATKINNAFPNIRAKDGEKTSRVINRLCTYLHYNEHPDYNREFAKYADALSPMKIKRHTILSLNPLDYLTMSFGNSWSSCHTIDKHNKRGMANGYEGCYSSGTVSYMLDGHSMVMYTVDSAYNGTDYYSQPKITRQMYHFGEDKLVQGRLYPQSCDGAKDSYKMYRNIVQEIMAQIFEFPNLWNTSHNISEYIDSEGTHYRDYAQFNSCTISIVTGTHNNHGFTIGAEPICVECGSRHDCEENINCCRGSLVTCVRCGNMVHEDDVREIDGEYYCDACCHYCDYCCEYVVGDAIYVSGYGTVCHYCRDEYFDYCENCDDWYHRNDMRYCEEDDKYYCSDCYDERMEQLEAERREAEEVDDTENTGAENVQWRVVDRAPRVGDYIRLKSGMFSFDRIGDILRIDGIHDNGVVYVLGVHHKRDALHPNLEWNYSQSRFEVIERVTESEEA